MLKLPQATDIETLFLFYKIAISKGTGFSSSWSLLQFEQAFQNKQIWIYQKDPDVDKNTEKNTEKYTDKMLFGQNRVMPMAFLIETVHVDHHEIELLVTNHDFWGQGIMTHLLQEYLSQVQLPIWLEVSQKNLPALGLYKKLGFYQVGSRPNYYPDGSAAILLNYEAKK